MTTVGKSLRQMKSLVAEPEEEDLPSASPFHSGAAGLPARFNPQHSNRVMPKTMLTTEHLLEELSMEEVITDVRPVTLAYEEAQEKQHVRAMATAAAITVGKLKNKRRTLNKPTDTVPALPLDNVSKPKEANANKGLVLSHR